MTDITNYNYRLDAPSLNVTGFYLSQGFAHEETMRYANLLPHGEELTLERKVDGARLVITRKHKETDNDRA